MDEDATGPEGIPRFKNPGRVFVLAAVGILFCLVAVPTFLAWWDSRHPDAGGLPAWIVGYQTEPGSLALDVVLALCPDDTLDSYQKTAEDDEHVALFIGLTDGSTDRCDERVTEVISFRLDEPLGDRLVTDGGSLEIPPYEGP